MRSLHALTLIFAISIPANAARGESEAHEKILPSSAWVVVPNGQKSSCGTGCLVDRERRLLVTCLHVVKDQTQATVFFPIFGRRGPVTASKEYLDQRTGINARVVATDSRLDLALLRLDQVPDEVPVAELAEKAPGPGQAVYGVGNSGNNGKPLDQHSLWKLYESKITRLPFSMQNLDTGGSMNSWAIEINNPIAPGDSGGPMVDKDGRLVGIGYGFDKEKGFATDVEELRLLLSRVQSPMPLAGPWTVKFVSSGKPAGFFKINFHEEGTLEWITDKKHPGKFKLQDDQITWIVPSLGVKETVPIVRRNENSFAFISGGVAFTITRR